MKFSNFYTLTLLFSIFALQLSAQNKLTATELSNPSELAPANQIIEAPIYRQASSDLVLDKIEYTENRTIMHFQWICDRGAWWTATFYPKGQYHSWFLKDKATNEEFELIEVHNITRNGELMKALVDEEAYSVSALGDKTVFACEVHFEKLPAHVQVVDLLEGVEQLSSSTIYFNAYDIEVEQPKDLVLEGIKELVKLAIVTIEEELDHPSYDSYIDAATVYGEMTSDLEIEIIEPEEEAAKQEEVSNLVQITPTWTIFPNPTTTHINIQQETTQEAQLAIHDINGRLIWSGTTQDQNTTIEVGNYPAGSYIVKMIVGDQVSAKKFILKK